MSSIKFTRKKVYDIPVKTIQNFNEAFTLEKLIHEGSNSAVYTTTNPAVILKITDIGFISTFRAGILEDLNYSTLSQRLPGEIIPTYHDGFMLDDNLGKKFILVLEYIPGKGLDKIESFTAQSYLHVSKWVFWALSHIHWKDMVYQGFDLRNFIYDESTGRLRIIDLKNMFATAGPRAQYEDSVDFKKEDVKQASQMLLSLQDRVVEDAGNVFKILESGLAELQLNRPTASQIYELLVDAA
jgi:hypothetical protein